MKTMRIELLNESQHRMPRKWLSRVAHWMGRELQRQDRFCPQEVALVFVDSSQMKKVNARHRGRSYATDILSFGAGEPIAELVMCPQVIAKNAGRADLARLHGVSQWSLKWELAVMVIHGFLHLSGLDHSDEARPEEEMLRIQAEMFSKFRKSLKRV